MTIFDAGPSKIVTQVGIEAVKEFSLNTQSVSYDTTSTNVWGDYSLCENEDSPPGPNITYGYSKDHRPDLKQFMTELLCVDRGIPKVKTTIESFTVRKRGRPSAARIAMTAMKCTVMSKKK